MYTHCKEENNKRNEIVGLEILTTILALLRETKRNCVKPNRKRKGLGALNNAENTYRSPGAQKINQQEFVGLYQKSHSFALLTRSITSPTVHNRYQFLHIVTAFRTKLMRLNIYKGNNFLNLQCRQSIQPLLIFLHLVCHQILASSKRLGDSAN